MVRSALRRSVAPRTGRGAIPCGLRRSTPRSSAVAGRAPCTIRAGLATLGRDRRHPIPRGLSSLRVAVPALPVARVPGRPLAVPQDRPDIQDRARRPGRPGSPSESVQALCRRMLREGRWRQGQITGHGIGPGWIGDSSTGSCRLGLVRQTVYRALPESRGEKHVGDLAGGRPGIGPAADHRLGNLAEASGQVRPERG